MFAGCSGANVVGPTGANLWCLTPVVRGMLYRGRRGRPGSGRFDLEGGGDVDRGHQGAGDGAVLRVRAQDAFRGGPLLIDVVQLEVVRHVDPAQDENLLLKLDFALGDSDETITG